MRSDCPHARATLARPEWTDGCHATAQMMGAVRFQLLLLVSFIDRATTKTAP